MKAKTIEVSTDKQGITTLCLNRPKTHNAIDDVMIDEITNALIAIDAQPDSRVLLITGKETVLAALSNMGGLIQFSSTNIWIARPAPAGFGGDQILPVDYLAITRGAAAGTNYQLMPHDRLYIAEDKTVALTNMINVALGPVEKLIGVASLGTNTSKNFKSLGRDYNSRFRR